MKLKTENGQELTSRSKILEKVVKFYRRLYLPSEHQPQIEDTDDSHARLSRNYHQDIPKVYTDKIRSALGQLTNGRVLGDDGITTELLKAGGLPVYIAP